MRLWKETLLVRAFGLAKIPLLALVQPSVLQLDMDRTEIRIPLNYFTRNHLKTMYFGALCIGADCAGGLFAVRYIRDTGNKVVFLFKDFQAQFLRRAEGDVHFINGDGSKIIEAIDETLKTGERVNVPLHVTATTPRISGNTPVAQFILTISLKRKR